MNSGQYNSELKRIQIQYDEKITHIIENLEQYSTKRLYDYKECEELARNAARMNLRWRRMTSLTQETLMEFENENKLDTIKVRSLEASLVDYSNQYDLVKSENEQLFNLISILEQVAAKIDSRHSEI